MTTESVEGLGPPYLPYATFLTALEALAQGLPPRLDRSVWPSQSGGVQSQLLKAFRFLRFTDENDEVLPILKYYVDQPEKRRDIMAELLVQAYPRVIDLSAVNASTQQLHDAFTALGVTGDTRRKAETFFLQAAEQGGLRLSSLWPTTKMRNAGTRSGTRTRTRAAPRAKRPPEPVKATVSPPPASTASNAKRINLASGGTVTLAVDVDWLTVSATDRKWLLDLVDKLNEYEQPVE